jgi:hypothetical protein
MHKRVFFTRYTSDFITRKREREKDNNAAASADLLFSAPHPAALCLFILVQLIEEIKKKEGAKAYKSCISYNSPYDPVLHKYKTKKKSTMIILHRVLYNNNNYELAKHFYVP